MGLSEVTPNREGSFTRMYYIGLVFPSHQNTGICLDHTPRPTWTESHRDVSRELISSAIIAISTILHTECFSFRSTVPSLKPNPSDRQFSWAGDSVPSIAPSDRGGLSPAASTS